MPSSTTRHSGDPQDLRIGDFDDDNGGDELQDGHCDVSPEAFAEGDKFAGRCVIGICLGAGIAIFIGWLTS